MWYDIIVVGAGSAGAVVASRLTEEPTANVLLIEAGRDYPSVEETPMEILDGSRPVVRGHHNWPTEAIICEQERFDIAARTGKVFAAASSRSNMIRAALASGLHGSNPFSTYPYPVGKLVGGSSAINGCLAMRAPPEDFDEWTRLGNEQWSWPSVEEYYKRIEHRGESSDNGAVGAAGLPIEHITPRQFTPLQQDFFDACKTMGFPERPVGDSRSSGVGGVSRNVEGDRRISSALGYLGIARKRKNLTVLANALADKVLFDGDRAVGVQIRVDGRERRVFAGEIVVCAGSLHTPGILMRSGVGAPPALEKLGIDVVSPLPGVGRNLIDHPSVGLWGIPAHGACQKQEEMHQAILHFHSEGWEVTNDMQLYMLSSVDTSLFPELKAALGVDQAVALSVVVAKPFSIGEVTIDSTRPEQEPRVVLNCAADRRDSDRLMQGVRLAWNILHQPRLHGKIARFFAWNDKVVGSDALLKAMIGTFVRGSWHAVGTTKMGPESDEHAVVDQYGMVYGCRNLRVADASIMPTITRSPPNLTVMMIGERISDHIHSPD